MALFSRRLVLPAPSASPWDETEPDSARGGHRMVAPRAASRIAVRLAQDGPELVRAVDLRVAPVTEPAPMVDRRDPACRARVLRAVLLPLQPLHLDHQVFHAVLAV